MKTMRETSSGKSTKLGMVVCPPNSKTRKTETGKVGSRPTMARPHDLDSERKMGESEENMKASTSHFG